ncbi:thiol reductant ABC exporter subunit CydD [Arthrobacter sp. YD4]|uniref:thiol reductant ABC exporter subunit CydD n=1 Tax=Arthrobacter sp. YD4 TaxID=3058043 RepID=UPI0025B3DC3B|nr:thiol reductant ABC exporter subunit CydD [Arthrobacter sp. YD4]MDN3937101.1 thiol reductant ABC exporter subunit CydD [Arthrobacter sp. YD4]
MRPQFPSGPATRSALYLLGLLAALKALSLVLMGQAVAAMLTGLAGHQEAWAEQLGWGLAGVVLRALTTWGQAVAARRAALGVKEELRSQLLERALQTGTRSSGPSDGGLAVLATRRLDALDNYYTQFLPALVNCAAIPLLLGARILLADWVSAVVIVLTVPLVPLFMILIGRYTEERVREAQSTLARLSGHMLELAKGLPVLVGLGRASAQRKALEDISEEYRTRTMGTLRTAFLSALALELIATLSVAVVAVFIGVRLVHGEMGLEAGLLALILAPDCYLPLRELGTAHHASDEGRAALADTTEVLDAPRPEPLLPADGTPAGAVAVPPVVAVSGLRVRYPGRDGDAVGPLDFTAPAGRITALDGPSGAGKSTILGVLAGTLAADAGTILEGRVSGYAAADVAWVPQHPVMVADTVLDEVLLYLGGEDTAPEDASREAEAKAMAKTEARRCLAACAAEHLAAKHPAELSPGELRRVAVARGLARIAAGATVLLLDEPTAHLDRTSADAVSAALTGLRGRATVLLVAHDRQTRELADTVVRIGAAASDGGTADGSRAGGGAVKASAGPAPAVPSTAAVSSVAIASPPPANRLAARADLAARGRPEPSDGLNPDRVDQAENPPAPEGTPGAIARLGRLLAPVAGRFTAAGVVGVLAALFAVALAGLSGWLIIRASEQPPILYLLTAIVGVRFFGVGRAALRYAERLLLHDAVFTALTRLRGELWESLSRRALSLRRLLQGGNVLGAVVDDVDTVRDLLPRVVLPPLTAVAVAAAALTGVGLLLPEALPAVAAAAIASLVAAPALALYADRRSASAEQRLRSGVLRRVAAALDARAELHANGVGGPVLAAIRRDDRAATDAVRRSAVAEGLGHALTVLACGSAALGCALLAAPQALAGSAQPAVVAVVVLLQLALIEPYAAMTTAVRQYPALRTVLRRIGESGVLEADRGTSGAGGPDGGLMALTPRQDGRPGLAAVDLAAAWPGGPAVFEGLSATAEPGRWLAVTGGSGSGKSTLLAVLLGFLPAAGGELRLTGRAAWCPQEAHLFDSTIRGNLMLGLPGGTRPSDGTAEGAAEGAPDGSPDRAAVERRLRDAVSAVGLTPLLARLDRGLDTPVGPGGAFLSGGERQRLAVARTLLTGADIILLDEPTAHLDAEAGPALLAELRRGLRERTVVLVTHNPDDVDPADARLDLDDNAAVREPAGVSGRA